MLNLIDRYINAHELAWAPTTLRSERARLNSVASLIASGPRVLYDAKVNELGPYTMRTLFIRLADLEDWANRGWGYKQFAEENSRLFKHAYKKERVNVSKDLITTSISSIEDNYLRSLADGLFRNGMRISELGSYNKDTGLVMGKGGRTRRLLAVDALPDTYPSARHISQLRAELKARGLKPHTLRKGAATLLARADMPIQDLMQVMGWSSMQTAASYLQPQSDEKLATFANNILGGV